MSNTRQFLNNLINYKVLRIDIQWLHIFFQLCNIADESYRKKVPYKILRSSLHKSPLWFLCSVLIASLMWSCNQASCFWTITWFVPKFFLFKILIDVFISYITKGIDYIFTLLWHLCRGGFTHRQTRHCLLYTSRCV